MEPISPELALVDPDLARRARALLPVPVEPGPVVVERPQAPRRSAPRLPRGLLVRGAAALALPSLILNVALLRDRAAPRSPAISAARPTVTPAPPPKRVRKASPTRERSSRPAGVAAARHVKKARKAPSRPRATRRTLRWPAVPTTSSYDVIIWRNHTRVADIWTTKPALEVDTLACGQGLAPGRYLWFVYPALSRRGGARYGPLVKWGRVDVVKSRCRSEERKGS
jgi:hypothetical protein